MKPTDEKKYISVTLLGGDSFETHKEALDHYKRKSAEFKGVFEVIKTPGVSSSIRSINLSGNVSNHGSTQLKDMAKQVAVKGSVKVDNAFMFKTNDIRNYLAGVEKAVGEDFPLLEVNKEDITSSYPLVDNLLWIKEDRGYRLDDDNQRVFISADPRSITASTTGTSLDIEWPYVALDNNEPLEEEEEIQLLKLSAHRMVEMIQTAMSIGWKAEDIIAMPRTETFQSRDPDSPNVWSSPIKLENLEDHPPKESTVIKSSMDEKQEGETVSAIKP